MLISCSGKKNHFLFLTSAPCYHNRGKCRFYWSAGFKCFSLSGVNTYRVLRSEMRPGMNSLWTCGENYSASSTWTVSLSTDFSKPLSPADGSLRLDRPKVASSRASDIVPPPKPARQLEAEQPQQIRYAVVSYSAVQYCKCYYRYDAAEENPGPCAAL